MFLCLLSSHRNFLFSQSQREEAKKFAEIKRKLRLEIQELRETVLQMMRENQEAPELERLDRHEYNLDVDQRQKLVLEGEEKIKQVWASNFKSQKQFLALSLNTEKYWWFANIAYNCEQGLLYKNSSLFCRLINPLLTKLVWSRWLNMGRVLFCGFIDLDSVHKNSKDNLANIQLS